MKWPRLHLGVVVDADGMIVTHRSLVKYVANMLLRPLFGRELVSYAMTYEDGSWTISWRYGIDESANGRRVFPPLTTDGNDFNGIPGHKLLPIRRWY